MMRWRSALMRPASVPLVWAACALPAVWLVYGAVADQLGANPAEALQHSTGLWALRFLCLTLAITPLRIHTRTPQFARFRRVFGLATFAYASLHVLTYAWFDMQWNWAGMAGDFWQRPFILVGSVAWFLLLLLALTSIRWVARWLGGRRWKALHKAIYWVVGLALLHFFWMRAGKNNFAEAWLYAVILGALLLDRVLRQGARTWRTSAQARRTRAAFKLGREPASE